MWTHAEQKRGVDSFTRDFCNLLIDIDIYEVSYVEDCYGDEKCEYEVSSSIRWRICLEDVDIGNNGEVKNLSKKEAKILARPDCNVNCWELFTYWNKYYKITATNIVYWVDNEPYYLEITWKETIWALRIST